MASRVSKGTCGFCGRIVGKAGMARHLASCETRPAPGGGRGLHLVVAGRYSPQYWLHLEVAEDATLDDLDDFLRATWVECCGHLSAFQIGGARYEVDPEARWGDAQGMDVPVGQALAPGAAGFYRYDFGSTTELALRCLSEGPRVLRDSPIGILARNLPPEIPCGVCDRPATQICMECVCDADGWICDACMGEHGCDEDMRLPVVNSPRVGVCGYTGSD